MLPFQQLSVICFKKYIENFGWNKVQEHFCVEKPSWGLDDNFFDRLDDFLKQIPEKQKLTQGGYVLFCYYTPAEKPFSAFMKPQYLKPFPILSQEGMLQTGIRFSSFYFTDSPKSSYCDFHQNHP